ncbi:hypothetical protein ACFVWT_03690 [Arthrobacter sp. NPDC058288]|uniref:hypothetical protein n=1 Tax=Arthrobacter sp. NPDC058288 TaxID=3346424 RepID=UPI0036E58944
MKLFLSPATRPGTARPWLARTRGLVTAIAAAVTVSAFVASSAHAAPVGGDEWVVSVGGFLHFGGGGPLGRQLE